MSIVLHISRCRTWGRCKTALFICADAAPRGLRRLTLDAECPPPRWPNDRDRDRLALRSAAAPNQKAATILALVTKEWS